MITMLITVVDVRWPRWGVLIRGTRVMAEESSRQLIDR